MIELSRIPPTKPVRIIIGAGNQRWEGWIPTDKEELDLLNPEDWERSFRFHRADAFLCEHVLEHLTEEEGRYAARLCYKWLKPGGYLRCAVPDGYFPDKFYQRIIQVGGIGIPDHPSTGHKMVYNYKTLSEMLIQAGFEVDLLEYFDEQGRFHYHQWSVDDGPVYRSLMLDWRNQKGKIVSASLIIDAKKRRSANTTSIKKRLIDFLQYRKPISHPWADPARRT